MIDLFLRDGLEAVAGVRASLEDYARTHRDMRVLDGRFMQIQQAIAVPKGRRAAADYLSRFVEEGKASGLVAEALQRSGQVDVEVAPPA
jgi:polar amino acid transport system substrate-binding protein